MLAVFAGAVLKTVLFLIFVVQSPETALIEEKHVLQPYPSAVACEGHLKRVMASPVALRAGLIGRCVTVEEAAALRVRHGIK